MPIENEVIPEQDEHDEEERKTQTEFKKLKQNESAASNKRVAPVAGDPLATNSAMMPPSGQPKKLGSTESQNYH